MSIILFILFVCVGVTGVCLEVVNKKTERVLIVPFVILFIACVCSRIGFDPGSDITHYIDFFITGNDTYFEPGYVFFTVLVRRIWDSNGIALIISVTVFNLFLVIMANKVCAKFSRTATDTSYSTRARFVLQHNPGHAKDDKTSLATVKCDYFFCFIFTFALYWGFSFCGEVIRLGMAICLLFCSIAYIINGYVVKSLFFVPIAFLFQYSSAIILAGFGLLFFAKRCSKRLLIYWLLVLMALDFAFSRGITSISLGESLLSKVTEMNDAFSHFSLYANGNDEGFSYSTQYWFYHGVGLLMAFGDLDDQRYAKSVLLFFVGLTVSTLFNGAVFSMRLQWVFLPSVVFALYYFLINTSFSRQRKIIILLCYTLLQIVMIIRLLGSFW